MIPHNTTIAGGWSVQTHNFFVCDISHSSHNNHLTFNIYKTSRIKTIVFIILVLLLPCFLLGITIKEINPQSQQRCSSIHALSIESLTVSVLSSKPWRHFTSVFVGQCGWKLLVPIYTRLIGLCEDSVLYIFLFHQFIYLVGDYMYMFAMVWICKSEDTQLGELILSFHYIGSRVCTANAFTHWHLCYYFYE